MRFRFSVLHQNILTALSEARKAAGISQRELSKQLKGVRNYNYVNLMEKGQRMPNMCELFAYIYEIGADPAEVARRVDELQKRHRQFTRQPRTVSKPQTERKPTRKGARKKK